MAKIDARLFKKLRLPRPKSHKGDNGRLLIIAGSKKYHGSLIYAVKTASRIVDLIYVLTTPENQKLIGKLKSRTAEFIPVADLSAGLSPRLGRGVRADCVLIGPGMGMSKQTYQLVKQVLRSQTKAVLDADALNVLDTKLKAKLSEKHILTPHHREFERLFNVPANQKNVALMAKRYGCTIVLKGPVDIIAEPSGNISKNHTGNAGLTKGGTGDVLAGLVAAFFCRNDAATAAMAGAFINGRAGDELYKKVGPFYNAEDLVGQIPKTMWNLIKGLKRS